MGSVGLFVEIQAFCEEDKCMLCNSNEIEYVVYT